MGEIDELTKELEVVKAEEETLLSLKQIISHQLSQLELEEVALREIISLEQHTRQLVGPELEYSDQELQVTGAQHSHLPQMNNRSVEEDNKFNDLHHVSFNQTNTSDDTANYIYGSGSHTTGQISSQIAAGEDDLTDNTFDLTSNSSLAPLNEYDLQFLSTSDSIVRLEDKQIMSKKSDDNAVSEKQLGCSLDAIPVLSFNDLDPNKQIAVAENNFEQDNEFEAEEDEIP